MVIAQLDDGRRAKCKHAAEEDERERHAVPAMHSLGRNGYTEPSVAQRTPSGRM
jgi:hypothetical protein